MHSQITKALQRSVANAVESLQMARTLVREEAATVMRTRVYYDKHDPNAEGIEYIAIEANTAPIVFGTYGHKPDIKIPSDLIIMKAEQAQRLFKFEKTNLCEL